MCFFIQNLLHKYYSKTKQIKTNKDTLNAKTWPRKEDSQLTTVKTLAVCVYSWQVRVNACMRGLHVVNVIVMLQKQNKGMFLSVKQSIVRRLSNIWYYCNTCFKICFSQHIMNFNPKNRKWPSVTRKDNISSWYITDTVT